MSANRHKKAIRNTIITATVASIALFVCAILMVMAIMGSGEQDSGNRDGGGEQDSGNRDGGGMFVELSLEHHGGYPTRIIQDKETGCQYIHQSNVGSYVTPRLGPDGLPMCGKGGIRNWTSD